MVQSGRGIQYKFEIHRKYTVIRGDSATGKTTLVNLIEDASVRKTASLSCDVPCVVLPEMNWQLNLVAFRCSIVFIDEFHPALAAGEELADLMKTSDNCFVIISRDAMPWIPYSYKEIYQIKASGKFHSLERVYNDMEHFIENPNYVTEDEAAGLQYFRKWLGNRVKTSRGNGNLSKFADKDVTLIGDGAAIGPHMYNLMLGKADLFLPESFEWLLLHSPVLHEEQGLSEMLSDPAAFIETSYQSWEEFFTEFLTRLTEHKKYHYSKENLNPCYAEECCFRDSYCSGFTTERKNITDTFQCNSDDM